VCFVPPDAAASAQDVAEGIRRLLRDAHVGAAAVGDAEGGPLEVTFFGLPWRSGRRRARREVLASVGSAVVLRRAAIESIGGYDAAFGDRAAELDLGWRLWLGGWRVLDLRAPSGDGTAPEPRSAVGDVADPGGFVDAVTVAWRCLDDRRATAALAGGLLLAPLLVGADDAASVLGSLREVVARCGDGRARVQGARTRDDAEILHLLGDPLEVPGLGSDALEPLLGQLRLDELFSGRRRILVVTGDVVGPGMAGPAIRAWHMAECLADEHEVVLATTSGRIVGTGAGFRLEAPDPTRFEELVSWCEIVVVQGFVLLHVPTLARSDRIMVVDVYDLLHLEALELAKRVDDGSRAEHVAASLHALNEQAARGDYFICASEKQRDYWVGHLSAAGRVNAATYGRDPLLRSLVDVVPFGLPSGAAVKDGPGLRTTLPGVGPGDDVLLWAGGVYDWLDPVTLVHAVDRLAHRRPSVRLVFMGMRHPNPEVPEMSMAVRARSLARSLGLEGVHVFFNEGWVDYEHRQNWLLDADVGVSTHFEHAETAYAWRTRLLDYLWAGLPVVATAGDAFADLIAREGLGRVVEPEDVEGLETALFELLADPGAAASCRRNAERVRASFEWPATLDPLLRFCRAPSRAADRVPVRTDGSEIGPFQRFKRRTRTAAALYAQGGGRAVLRVASARLGTAGFPRGVGPGGPSV